MQNHLSVNAASELLERTRRTVKRALPCRTGLPRTWSAPMALPKIIQALETSGAPMTLRHGGETDRLVKQCDALLARFDAAFERLKVLPALLARREAAIKLYPAIDEKL